MKTTRGTISQLVTLSFAIIILPLFLISCNQGPQLPDQNEAKDSIWEKIEAANEKWASGDPMGFLECAAQDIIWSDDLGAQYRVTGYDSLKKYLGAFIGQIPSHRHVLIDPVFQFYGDMVIVSYRYQGIFEGEEPAAPWKVTSVYRYADGDWLSVHENWTEVKQ